MKFGALVVGEDHRAALAPFYMWDTSNDRGGGTWDWWCLARGEYRLRPGAHRVDVPVAERASDPGRWGDVGQWEDCDKAFTADVDWSAVDDEGRAVAPDAGGLCLQAVVVDALWHQSAEISARIVHPQVRTYSDTLWCDRFNELRRNVGPSEPVAWIVFHC